MGGVENDKKKLHISSFSLERDVLRQHCHGSKFCAKPFSVETGERISYWKIKGFDTPSGDR